jgi:hypothetical protein
MFQSDSLSKHFSPFSIYHTWANLLKEQTSITVYRLPTKENKLAFSVFRFQKTKGGLPFPFSVCSKQTEVAVSVYIYI